MEARCGDMVKTKNGDTYLILRKGYSDKLRGDGFMALNSHMIPRYLPEDLIVSIIGHHKLGGMFK